jgi:hypothetical protein
MPAGAARRSAEQAADAASCARHADAAIAAAMPIPSLFHAMPLRHADGCRHIDMPRYAAAAIA